MHTTRLTTKPLHEVTAAIQALDLTSVKVRMMDEELGEGWSQEYADSIEAAYKTYLTMLAKYPEHAEEIMLATDVDEFWHTHILQTMKYADDCEKVFGSFLHHNPHVGKVTAEDLEHRTVLAEKTRRLYEQEFGGASDTAWSGRVSAAKAAYSAAAVSAERAAYSAASIRAETAAYSAATIRAADAAYSAASIREERAAYSAASIKAGNAAYSAAAIRAESAAYSAASIKAQNAAYSAAAIQPENSAYSAAAIRVENAAYSAAAIKAKNAAYSAAAIKHDDAAYAGAAIRG